MDRLAVGDEDALEGKVEHLSECRQHPLLIPGRLPNPQEPVGGGHAVGKDQGSLLGKIERRLHSFAAVVEGHQPARQDVVGPKALQLGAGKIVGPEQKRAEGADSVPAHEQLDVAEVIGLEYGKDRRPQGLIRLQTATALGGGASGSSRRLTPSDSAAKEATSGRQSSPFFQSGCGWRQSQRPGATSRTSTVTGRSDQRFAFARVRAAFFAELLRFLAFCARVFAAFSAAFFRFCGPWLIRS